MNNEFGRKEIYCLRKTTENFSLNQIGELTCQPQQPGLAIIVGIGANALARMQGIGQCFSLSTVK